MFAVTQQKIAQGEEKNLNPVSRETSLYTLKADINRKRFRTFLIVPFLLKLPYQSSLARAIRPCPLTLLYEIDAF